MVAVDVGVLVVASCAALDATTTASAAPASSAATSLVMRRPYAPQVAAASPTPGDWRLAHVLAEEREDPPPGVLGGLVAVVEAGDAEQPGEGPERQAGPGGWAPGA